MVKLRSQEDDPVPQWFSRIQEAYDQRLLRIQEETEQRFSRLEAMVADYCASMKQTNQTNQTGGSDHFEGLRGDWRKKENPEDQICNDEELTEIEAETKSSGIEDRAVENEENANENLDILEEESIAQIQVPVSSLEPSLQFRNASPDVCEDFKALFGFDGLFDHVKARNELVTKSTSVTNNQVAYQLFDVIPMRTKVLPKEHKKRFHKSWRFKFKDKVQPRGLIQEQLGVHEGNATRNQLRSPSGFVVDDLHSGFGSDIWCVQFLVGSVVVEDFQETQWLFNDELKDNQIFQILIEEGSNSSAYQKFNGMRIGSHRLHHQKKPSKSPKSWKFKFKISSEDTAFVFKMDHWCRARYRNLETESFLEIESMPEDVQLVLLAFLHVNATEPRHAIGEHDEMCEAARDVSMRSMLVSTFGKRESNAGQEQQAVYEQIITVNEWLYQISLVSQQVMSNTKLKLSKRWWFKYKYHCYSFCQESFANPITSFSTNLEVKVSLKEGDLMQI